jgi:hypothetical protein
MAPAAPLRRPERFVALQRRLAFLVPLAASLPVAWVLVLRYHSIYNDALSRLANAYYVFYSRDPHLAAVGFVWNPLPSVMDMPLLLFKGWWPALSRDAFAANIVSCVWYAVGCHQLFRFLQDLRVRPVARWALWLCFAANPLVFYYAVNGMSESMFIGMLILTARDLSQGLENGRARPLVIAAFWLGIAYLARNEAVAPAAAAGITVLAVSYRRSTGLRRRRMWAAATDFSLFVIPALVSFVFWALLSWIIVGSPFEQFTSQYGNSAQVKASGNAFLKFSVFHRLGYALTATVHVAPLLIVAVLLALWGARTCRDLRALAPLVVMVPVLVFEILAYGQGQIFPWFRYYIYACPAVVMFGGCIAACAWDRNPYLLRNWGMGEATRRLAVTSWSATLAIAIALPGFFTTAKTLGTYTTLAQQDRYQFAYILWPSSSDGKQATLRETYTALRGFAAQIDSMHLPHGALMVDNFTTCIPELILDSARPKAFAIPNDEDYEEKFGVPYQFGVRYFLVPDPRTNPVDALNRHLPGLYDTGQGLATLVRQISLKGCPTFRLYKVTPSQA